MEPESDTTEWLGIHAHNSNTTENIMMLIMCSFLCMSHLPFGPILWYGSMTGIDIGKRKVLSRKLFKMEVVQLGVFRHIFALLTAQWYFKVQFKSFQTFQHVLHSKLPWHRCKPLHTPITCSQVFNLIDLEMEEEIWTGELSLSLPVPQTD